ncbi:hypothetical protein GGS26DRAFT_589976 [Hypomontagnella submonticulosa]|nr:hypothetical protein GGS26DRAFT_589976 [Hypomontagnella submonticulosa]
MRPFFAIFAAILAFIQVAAAIPPACLLAALGVQDNPSDLKAVCGDLQDAIQGNITQNCHTDMVPKAYEVYSSKCLEQGVTVADLPTSTSSSASHSSTGGPSSTGTGPASNSATPTDAASGTTGGASTSNTGSGSSPSPTNAGMAMGPQPFLFAAVALLATGLTSVIFL